MNRDRDSTSPYRPSSRLPGPSESLESIIRALERENAAYVEEINTLRNRARRVSELEEKIDQVVRHNDDLLSENERLSKMISQKRGEVDTWKAKFETMAVNKSAASELESRKLINEIEKLKEEITQIEHLKNMQINELKNNHHLDIQNLKRNNLGSNEKYELEIRKLKEYCEKKEYEISDMNMKFVRLNKETDFEIGKLREEKDRLRSDLMYEEAEHKKEVDGLKAKFEYNFHSQIENLKKQHLNQIEALQYENMKLKEVINSKNNEIQQILGKNVKVKNNYEDSIDLLKKENEDLKDKIFETERIAEIELINLRDKLEGIKESELSLLKNAHLNQLDLQNRQISRLRQIIENRNIELEILAKERNQIRESLENEILKVKAELQAEVNEKQDLAIKFQQELRNYEYDLKQKNEEMQIVENELHDTIATLKQENSQLNDLLIRKTDSLEQARNDHDETKHKLSTEIQILKEKSNLLKDDLERQARRGNSEADDLRKIAELKTRQFETKIKGLEQENAEKDNLIIELKETIKLKEKQIKISDEKIDYLENCEKDLRRELKENNQRWQAKENQYNHLIKTQIQTMERTRKRESQELKNISQNKISSLKHQIKELERHIEDKNRNINDLKDKYEVLVNKFQQIFGQRAAQKNLDIKIPGWIPETIATKNLFDVFLKNKVLEYCS